MTAEEHTHSDGPAALVLPGEVGLADVPNLGPKYHCQVEVREVPHSGRGAARLKSYFASIDATGVRDGKPLGVFLNGTGLPVSSELAHRWVADKQHYRIDIELPFVEAPMGLARRVMQFAETNYMPTEGWVGAPVHQFNGEDVTNIFVLCRGVDRHGDPFKIDPDVAAIQLRDAVAVELEKELGPRTEEQVAHDMAVEAHRKSVTGLDYQLANLAKISGDRLWVNERDLETAPGSVRRREHLVARLEKLKEFGFARQTGRFLGPRGWHIRANFRRGLQDLRGRQIITAQLWGKPELLDALAKAKTPRHVEGILVGKGTLNPPTGEHWVLVRRNDEHYLAKTWASKRTVCEIVRPRKWHS